MNHSSLAISLISASIRILSWITECLPRIHSHTPTMSMNIFRLCGDMSRLLSIVILLRRLHTAHNAQGISLRTQELYLVVVLARYTDLLTDFYTIYNSFMKIVFIAAQCCVIGLIRCNGRVASTYDKDQDDFPHWNFLVLPSMLVAMVSKQFEGTHYSYESLFYWQELLWKLSIILEAVAIVPQLSLLRKYRMIDNLTGNYVFFLGLYRLLYIVNWFHRAHTEYYYRHNYLVYVCGCIQVILYADFFYYWLLSKREGRALSYGEEGDTEYYDCDVNELRNYENSSSLIEHADVRMRVTSAASDGDEETQNLIDE